MIHGRILTEHQPTGKTMPKIKFTKQDLLESKQLTPGWRQLVCKSVDYGPGKNDPSSNVYTCVFVIDSGADAGVPIRVWFSEKQTAIRRLVDYLSCFTPNGELDESKEYDVTATIGLKLEGYCLHEVNDNGQRFNTIQEFRKLGGGRK